jgi:protocatechuate 3,4-dioxygenase beta subunit
MKDFTLENLTDAVLAEYGKAKDPRFREIMSSLIRHLHGFARDVNLTEAEWFEGIRFLTETGQMCDDRRQEFILLSDVLGMSMMVDAINHPREGHGTESTVLGPFYVPGSPERAYGASIIEQASGKSPAVVFRGRVTDAGGKPLSGASVDVWQNSGAGMYAVQDDSQPAENMRGKFTTRDDGSYAFVTEKPLPYSIPTDGPVGRLLGATERHGMRPAHVHFIVSAPKHRPVTTHVFMEGSDYLNSDAVFATKGALIAGTTTIDDAELASLCNVDNPFDCIQFDFGLMPA